MNNLLNDLELPDGAAEVTASVTDDSQKAGDTGTPVIADNEAEPAPASSDSPSDVDERIEEAFRKTEILGRIEPLLNGLYNRLNNIINVGNNIKQIVGSTVARYLVTEQQVKRFEVDFVSHFDKELQEKMKAELCKFSFDLEHICKEELNKFNHELKNGWWFSNKVGWFLYMSNLITLLGAILYCSYK